METIDQPAIDCWPLPEFDETSPEKITAAFRDAATVEMTQSWLPVCDEEFRPATVRMGWRNEALLILAELKDEYIFSHATALNQKTWELGDAFEIFLRPVHQSAYLEFHVTPNNQRLQLRFPDAEAVRSAQLSEDFRPYFLEGNVIETLAWTHPVEKRWFAFARIPARFVCDLHQSLEGQKWLFSFCRYDYGKECKTPILSSSSPHREPDFHCQSAWRMMIFTWGE